MQPPYSNNQDPMHGEREALPLSDRPINRHDQYVQLVNDLASAVKDVDFLKGFADAIVQSVVVDGTVEGANRYPLEQTIEHSGRKLKVSKAVTKTSSQNDLGSSWLSEDNGSGLINVPLLSSMIWIRMSRPNLEDLMTLAERLLMTRAQYGRESVGTVLSALDVDLIDDCVSFCLRHVTSSTAKTKDLKSIILASDYQVILAAMAHLIYPEGYPYSRQCQNQLPVDSEEQSVQFCGHKTKGVLAIDRMIVHGWSRLTDAQLDWMADRQTQRTKDEIRAMQYGTPDVFDDEGEVKVNGTAAVASNRLLSYDVVTINGNTIRVYLRNPTLSRYISESQKWVRRMSTMADKVAATKSEQERAEYIRVSNNITILQQQSHLIYKIEKVNEDGDVVRTTDNVEGITSIIRAYSAYPDFVKGVLSAYQEAIGEMTMSWVGLPIEKCQSCGEHPEGYEENQIMPLPIAIMFFTLAVFRSNEARLGA